MFLYRGLARGRMAVVSPLTGVLAAVVPVVAGLAGGERPAALALGGVGVALLAIVLVSSAAPSRPRAAGANARLLTLATSDVTDGVAAGLAYGVFFVLLGATSGDAAVWPLVGVQAATVAVLAPLAWLTGRSVRPAPGGIAGIACCSPSACPPCRSQVSRARRSASPRSPPASAGQSPSR